MTVSAQILESIEKLSESSRFNGRLDGLIEAAKIAEKLFEDKTRRNVGREIAAEILKRAKETKIIR